MRLLVLFVLALGSSAFAMPLDMDEIPARLPPAFTCPPNSDWSKLQRCLQTKDKVVIVRDLPFAKLVRRYGKATASPTYFLYMQVSGVWKDTSFAWSALEGYDVGAIAELANGAVQIEATVTSPTSVALDEVIPRPAVLRRKMTTVCTGRAECYTVQTSCDLSVRGKAYWWFRGRPVWD